jgi:hypothetical protein
MASGIIRSRNLRQGMEILLNGDIAKRMANFVRRILRRMCGGIKIYGIWRKVCNKEIKQQF